MVGSYDVPQCNVKLVCRCGDLVLLHCTCSRNKENGMSAQLVVCMNDSRIQQGSAVDKIGLNRNTVRWVQKHLGTDSRKKG